jgi:hypothetical protein
MCATVVIFSFPCCAQAIAGLPACEAKSPTIEKVTLKEVTTAGVALEAQINPQGNETSYEFLIVWRALKPMERGEPFRGDPPPQEGRIGAGSSDVTVSAFLAGLQPGYTYWYQVVATSLGNNTRSDASALPYFNPDWYYTGLEEGPPYVPPERAGCSGESGDLAAAETVREQRAKEAAEAAAKEAAAKEAAAKEQAAEEAALKRATEEHRDAIAPAGHCTVPDVRGDTLSAARRAIDNAHCRLGRVRRPSHHRGVLVVTGETPPRGKTLGNGASVTLVMGTRPHAA